MKADDSTLIGQRLLVVVAHPDDETACAVLLQRAHEALVVFATDGAPAAEFFWSAYHSRRHYAEVRHAEALQSLRMLKSTSAIFLRDATSGLAFRDQELFHSVPSAVKALELVARQFRPDALLAPAYEGGHPDHDVCSYMVSAIGRSLAISRWEMPLYHRSPDGELAFQSFRVPGDNELLLNPSSAELKCRDEMIRKYVSQPDLSNVVNAQVERFRPQPDYDYNQPPHSGRLNYEMWGWPMTGADLCAAFQCFEAERAKSTASN